MINHYHCEEYCWFQLPLVNTAFPSAILKRLLYFLSGSADTASDHQIWRPSGPAFLPFSKHRSLYKLLPT